MPRGYLKRYVQDVGRKKSRGGNGRKVPYSRTPWKKLAKKQAKKQAKKETSQKSVWKHRVECSKYRDLSEDELKDISLGEEGRELDASPTVEVCETNVARQKPSAEMPVGLISDDDETRQDGEGDDTFDSSLFRIEGMLCVGNEEADKSEQSISLCSFNDDSINNETSSFRRSIQSIGVSSTTSSGTLWEFITDIGSDKPKTPSLLGNESYALSFDQVAMTADEESFSMVSTSIISPPNTTTKSLGRRCAICLESKTSVKRFMNRCSHPAACAECLRAFYIEHQLGDVSNFPLQCFWPGCKRVVRDVQIRRLAPQKLAFYYNQEQRARQFRWIAKQEALEAFMYRNIQQRRIWNLKTLQDCSMCLTAQPIFPGRSKQFVCQTCSCEQQSSVSPEEMALIVHALGDCLVNCPSCERMINKDGGCDHMLCVCGEEFSFVSAQAVLKKSIPNPLANS